MLSIAIKCYQVHQSSTFSNYLSVTRNSPPLVPISLHHSLLGWALAGPLSIALLRLCITPGIYPTHCKEVLLLPLAYTLHTVLKCYYYPWHISYTLYRSVTITPGIYPTHCTEVLLLPLAYILQIVQKCYYYPWHISYTL